MNESASASKVKRTVKVLGVAAACYAAYVFGTVVVITGHELAHFAGGDELPTDIVFAPTEASFQAAHPHETAAPTLVYYADQFVPAITGTAFFDPSNYAGDPLQGHTVAAAWLGPISASHQLAVTLFPFYVAVASSILAAVLALAWRRLPVFTFGLAVSMGGFYTIHHLIEAGLTMPEGVLVAFGVFTLYAIPAGFAFYLWLRDHVRPQPRRRTFRPTMPKVYGYTVMPYAGGVQFTLLAARGPSPSQGHGLMTRNAHAAAGTKPRSTKMAPMTASSAVARTDSVSLSPIAPLPNSM